MSASPPTSRTAAAAITANRIGAFVRRGFGGRSLHSAVEVADLVEDLLGVLRGDRAIVVERDAEVLEPRHCAFDLPLEEIGYLFVEHFGGMRITHVVALQMVLRGVDVGGHDSFLLDPEPMDVVFESQTRGEEGRQNLLSYPATPQSMRQFFLVTAGPLPRS